MSISGTGNRSISPVGSMNGEEVRPFYPEHQRISFKILPQERRLKGITDISLRANSGNLQSINLNARYLDLKQVSCDGEPCQFEISKWDVELTKGVPFGENPLQYPECLRSRLVEEIKQTELKVHLARKPPTLGSTIKLSFHYEIPLAEPYNHPGIMFRPGENGIFQLTAMPIANIGRTLMPCFEEEEISWDFDFAISLTGMSRVARETISVATSGALCQQFINETEEIKVFQFRLDVPTIPSRIAFACGFFETMRIPNFPFATIFTHQGMSSKLQVIVDFLGRAFGFMNWYLGGVSFPYPSFQLLFIRDVLALEEHHSGANIAFLSSLHLLDESIIDQVFDTRLRLCRIITEQYFGVRLRGSRWITTGITIYLAKLMLRVFHGRNDFLYNCKRDLCTLLQMEHGTSRTPLIHLSEPFLPRDQDDLRWLELKSYLVIWVLENRLEEGFLQKILSHVWDDYLNDRLETGLTNSVFLRLCKKIAGRDMKSFADQWILTAGCPIFTCSFTFNRKKSSIDVDFKQSTPGFPQKKVAGSLLIRVHEIDGVYDHSVHIDDFSHHFELPVHAKAKKIKKKRKAEGEGRGASKSNATINVSGEVPSSNPPNGESGVRGRGAKRDDTEEYVSPLSWIRLDPEMEWLATLELRQPDYMLMEQLKHDKDVVAQFEAIQLLQRHPATDIVVETFEKIMMDPKLFYRIRMDAIMALATLAPSQETHLGGLKLISYYNKTFALQSSETVVVPVPRTNNFENMQAYFVLTTLSGAMGAVRTRNNTLMELIGQILLNMLRYNDNAGNNYSDAHHLARIIDALLTHLQGRREIGLAVERLSKEFIRELDRYAIVERVNPYFLNLVMQAIVRSWIGLKAIDITPSFAIVSPEMLLSEGNFPYLRVEALKYVLIVADDQQLVINGLNLICSPKLVERQICTLMLASLPTSHLIRWKSQLSQEELWKLVSYNRGNPVLVCFLLAAFGKLVEPSSQDGLAKETEGMAAKIPSKISLKLVIPKVSDAEGAPVTNVDVGEEPDWYFEVADKETIRSRPISSFNARSRTPTAVPFSSSASAALSSRLIQVLHSISNHYDSFPFRNPVDPSVPGYYDIIKQPMDLSTLEEKVQSNRINSLLQFCSDLRLIFDNCFQFNQPDSVICEQAKRLKSYAIKELKRQFPEHTNEIKNMMTSAILSFTTQPKDNKPIASKRSKTPKKKKPRPREHHNEDLSIQERMKLIMQKTKEHPYAFWFLSPVDPVALNIPTYLEIIKEPMDLGTLEQCLVDGELAPQEFARLMNLIFTNCTNFNPVNTIVHQNALEMRKAIQKLIKLYLPEAQKATPSAPSKQVPAIHANLPTPEEVLPDTPEPARPLKLKITVPSKSSPSWQKRALGELLPEICQHEYAQPFLLPVDPVSLGIPTYPKIIKHPMDLSTIRAKLEEELYGEPGEMDADFKLMFANCYKFNGKKAPISEASKILEFFYNQKYREIIKGDK